MVAEQNRSLFNAVVYIGLLTICGFTVALLYSGFSQWPSNYVRLAVLKEACNQYHNVSDLVKPPLPTSQLLLDHDHKVLFCQVIEATSPIKVRPCAIKPQMLTYSSNLDSVLHLKQTRSNAVDQKLTLDLAPEPQTLPALADVKSDEDRAKILSSYTKVLIAQNPLLRVLSAYLDNIEHVPVTDVDKYSLETTGDGGISFNGFVKSLLAAPPTSRQDLEPISSICKPCLINFDYIAMSETLETDANYMPLKPILSSIRWYGGENGDEEKMIEYYHQLDTDNYQRLVKRYEMDFKLFGYSQLEKP